MLKAIIWFHAFISLLSLCIVKFITSRGTSWLRGRFLCHEGVSHTSLRAVAMTACSGEVHSKCNLLFQESRNGKEVGKNLAVVKMALRRSVLLFWRRMRVTVMIPFYVPLYKNTAIWIQNWIWTGKSGKIPWLYATRRKSMDKLQW